jgi:hypothetical protein
MDFDWGGGKMVEWGGGLGRFGPPSYIVKKCPAQDSFLATAELSLGLETIINETRIQISHGSVLKNQLFRPTLGHFAQG